MSNKRTLAVELPTQVQPCDAQRICNRVLCCLLFQLGCYFLYRAHGAIPRTLWIVLGACCAPAKYMLRSSMVLITKESKYCYLLVKLSDIFIPWYDLCIVFDCRYFHRFCDFNSGIRSSVHIRNFCLDIFGVFFMK